MLKQLEIRSAACSAVLAVLVLIVPGCGKRKPPLPPVERVVQRVQINGTQFGNEIRVSWQMPARNAPDGSVLNISRVDIYRLAEPLTASLTLSEEEFASRSTLIGSVPIQDSDFALKQKTFVDTLQLAGQPVRLRYAVRFVNASGQRAAFSNFLLIEPTAAVASVPVGIRLALSQDAVTISWESPASNVDGTSPANILGFNIYRTDSKGETRRLNDSGTVSGNEFKDEFFVFGDKYQYFVRTVSLGTNAGQVESLDSDKLSITPQDTFPPAPPEAVTIAASTNVISLFFAANVETDVAGYQVFRTTDPDKPVEEWELITPDLLDVTTFQDRSVNSGIIYFYYIKAVDKTGNVSAASEIVSDSIF